MKIERRACILKGQCTVGDRSWGLVPVEWLGARTLVSPHAEGPVGGRTLRTEPVSGASEQRSFRMETRRICLETGL